MKATTGAPSFSPLKPQLLRNMIRAAPAERSWEPMQLRTSDGRAAGDEVPLSSRSSHSDDRDCVRRRASYLCLETEDDLEEPNVDLGDSFHEEEVRVPVEPMAESIYSFAIASLIRDSVEIHKLGRPSLRLVRICAAFLLCALTFTMQALLMIETKRLVTPSDVKHVRQVYGRYEHTMYRDASKLSHTFLTSNGYD